MTLKTGTGSRPEAEVDRTVYRVVAAAQEVAAPPRAVLRLLGDYFVALYRDLPVRVFKAIAVRPTVRSFREGDVVLVWEVRTRLVDGIPVARVRTPSGAETSLSLARWIASRWSANENVEGLHAVALDDGASLRSLRWVTSSQSRSDDGVVMIFDPCAQRCATLNESSVSDRRVADAVA